MIFISFIYLFIHLFIKSNQILSFFSPWDISRFLAMQCELSRVPMPGFAKRWINLRKLYRNFYRVQGNIEQMLQNLEMEFEGRPHSGLDDSRNIARILQKMLEDGCELRFNECFSKSDNSYLRKAKAS